MWEYEHRVRTTAAPEAIWSLWSDVDGWGTWNAALENVAIHGPFTVGSRIEMTPVGQDVVELRLAEEITGPAADAVGPELGPEITADFPQTMAALVGLAEKR
jgi:hypothetical protein